MNGAATAGKGRKFPADLWSQWNYCAHGVVSEHGDSLRFAKYFYWQLSTECCAISSAAYQSGNSQIPAVVSGGVSPGATVSFRNAGAAAVFGLENVQPWDFPAGQKCSDD